VRGLYLLVLTGCGRFGFGAVADGSGSEMPLTVDTRPIDAPADAAIDVMLPPADALPPCTKLAITDDFNDGVRNAQWTFIQNNPVTTAETGGVLSVMLASSGGAHYGGYDSAATFDLTNHCMNISFVGVPTSETNVEMDFTARTAAGAFGFSFHSGSLDPYINAGTFVSQGAIPFSATTTKVVLVREDSGKVTWETSPDGITYTVIATAPTPFAVTAITIAIESGTFSSEPSPGTALYDDFDLP
jgi:hypothetical protein